MRHESRDERMLGELWRSRFLSAAALTGRSAFGRGGPPSAAAPLPTATLDERSAKRFPAEGIRKAGER
jgi:hypothetical protein